MNAESAGSVVAVTSLREFFRDAFHAASEHQHLHIDANAEAYVVNLLTMFARAEALYEQTADGLRIKPLARMLAESLEAPTPAPGTAACSAWATSRCSSPASLRAASRAS
jgi:hypothetical protein